MTNRIANARTFFLLAFTVALVVLPGTRADAQSRVYVAALQDAAGCTPTITHECPKQPGIYTVDSIGGAIVSAFSFPLRLGAYDHVVADPGGRRIYFAQPYASCPGGGYAACTTAVWWVDPATGTYNPFGTVIGLFRGLVVSPDGATVYCLSNATANAWLTVFDTTTNATAGNKVAETALNFSGALAVSPETGRIYVAELDAQARAGLTILDLATYARIGRIDLSAIETRSYYNAASLSLTSDGAHVYASMRGPVLVDIDTAGATVAAAISLSAVPGRVVFSGGAAYTATPDSQSTPVLTVIDTATDSVIRTLPLAESGTLAIAGDGETLFVQHWRYVEMIDISTLTSTTLAGFAEGAVFMDVTPVPPEPATSLTIDGPATRTLQTPFDVTGWAIETPGYAGGPGMTTVHAWAYPADGASPIFIGADYGQTRSDVAAQYGDRFLNSGYRLHVATLSPGAYMLVVYGRCARSGEFAVVRTTNITVVAPHVELSVDVPLAGAARWPRFDVAGWALDPFAPVSTGVDAVHAWVYPDDGSAPVFVGAAALGEPRPDVGALYGAQFGLAGYRVSGVLPPGRYTLVVFARSTATATFLASRDMPITIVPPEPLLSVDVPQTGTVVPEGIYVAGWALEFGAALGPGVDAVHVWAYPVGGGTPWFLGAATYGLARPDVAAAFGDAYGLSGFALSGTLPRGGSYDLAVYPHSSTSGLFTAARVVRVTVQ